MQQSGSLQFTDLCVVMGQKHTRWNVARLALGSLLLVMSPAIFGQVVDDFDIRFQAQQNGGIQFLANTTMYCGTGSSCTQAQNAMPITGFPQDNNNGHSMQYYDGDNDPWYVVVLVRQPRPRRVCRSELGGLVLGRAFGQRFCPQ